MSVSITHADNGWIITDHAESPEDMDCVQVFEAADDPCAEHPEIAEVEAWQRCLWALTELMGPGNDSRHAAARIRITVEPGDKFGDGQDMADVIQDSRITNTAI